MAGRGDNNKSGSSGRGASNQSNQAMTKPASREKSNHGSAKSSQRSEPQRKTRDQSANRNTSVDGGND